MSDITLELKKKDEEATQKSIQAGTLTWGSNTYSVKTGGYGKGPLPVGSYTIEVRKAVDNIKNEPAYTEDGKSEGWFLPVTPKFDTTRDGFGIHPDGNVVGTKGCVGLVDDDASEFWKDWLDTSLSSRPTKLVVSEGTE